ncbi:hypothetical protein OSB04_000794 [Centaurea solstitialis]|uniref:SNF2 N-terminal domain-containing protein n=1 Tax=Centaurea solstitialis TaxID=347529 RepID=A0AA38TX88_9ASTR|nr:hypothetical protein OSB04_000794 [Centaurea solstitialis]
MKQEEEDRALLNSLGVTSANPEQIEHDILEEARNHAEQVEGTADDEHLERRKSNEPSCTGRTDVLNKLRAINVEINAVASTVEDVKNFSRAEEHVDSGDDENGPGDLDGERSILQASSNDLILQQALAAARLESLKRTKAQLEKQFENLGNEGFPEDSKNAKVLQSIVKEEPNRKRKQKEIPTKNKKLKKRLKTVAFNDDGDFDAVLNAASAGLVETERDELVRKGILTPFHNLKGYERRIEEPGPSHSIEEGDKGNDLSSTSIARAVKSMSEAAQARPTTKLLDPDSLPRLDAPTRPFQRLKTPFKIPQSEGGKSKDSNRKKRRPLPGKKWRKVASREENSLEEIEDAKGSSAEEDIEEGVVDAEGDEVSFVTLEGGLKIPSSIFSQLFDYQKVGVQWLWELHCQRAGGIIGDEMGLGKTIQVLSFLGALHFSKMYKPSIVICPVTLLRQWRREAKKWYPSFHVEILHDSALDASHRKKQAKSDESDYETTSESDDGGEEVRCQEETRSGIH